MTTIFAVLGMALGLIKDISHAKAAEASFDWMGWLGERPFQVVGRILVTLGVLTPAATELANTALADVSFAGAPLIIKMLVPLLVGLYGDKIEKNVLEQIESRSDVIPVVGRLFAWGKKLT